MTIFDKLPTVTYQEYNDEGVETKEIQLKRLTVRMAWKLMDVIKEVNLLELIATAQHEYNKVALYLPEEQKKEMEEEQIQATEESIEKHNQQMLVSHMVEVLAHLVEAQEDVDELVGMLLGISAKEVSKLPIDLVASALIAVKDHPDISVFLKMIKSLQKKEEK